MIFLQKNIPTSWLYNSKADCDGLAPLISSKCWAPRGRCGSIRGVSYANRDGRSNGLPESAGVSISLALNSKTWGATRE
jgi:hypothetical protein